MLEIRDLDEWTTREEIQEIISSKVGCGQGIVSIISLIKQYEVVQVSLALVPQDTARRLSELGRINIGMIYCRIRECDKRARYFKCLAFGHDSGTCGGIDRSK